MSHFLLFGAEETKERSLDLMDLSSWEQPCFVIDARPFFPEKKEIFGLFSPRSQANDNRQSRPPTERKNWPRAAKKHKKGQLPRHDIQAHKKETRHMSQTRQDSYKNEGFALEMRERERGADIKTRSSRSSLSRWKRYHRARSNKSQNFVWPTRHFPKSLGPLEPSTCQLERFLNLTSRCLFTHLTCLLACLLTCNWSKVKNSFYSSKLARLSKSPLVQTIPNVWTIWELGIKVQKSCSKGDFFSFAHRAWMHR